MSERLCVCGKSEDNTETSANNHFMFFRLEHNGCKPAS